MPLGLLVCCLSPPRPLPLPLTPPALALALALHRTTVPVPVHCLSARPATRCIPPNPPSTISTLSPSSPSLLPVFFLFSFPFICARLTAAGAALFVPLPSFIDPPANSRPVPFIPSLVSPAHRPSVPCSSSHPGAASSPSLLSPALRLPTNIIRKLGARRTSASTIAIISGPRRTLNPPSFPFPLLFGSPRSPRGCERR